MKLIPLFLLFGILSVSGWAEDKAIYSPELVKRAELGDANAQCELGICYSEGTGVPMNEKKATQKINNKKIPLLDKIDDILKTLKFFFLK
jgi:hypothetical protein